MKTEEITRRELIAMQVLRDLMRDGRWSDVGNYNFHSRVNELTETAFKIADSLNDKFHMR